MRCDWKKIKAFLLRPEGNSVGQLWVSTSRDLWYFAKFGVILSLLRWYLSLRDVRGNHVLLGRGHGLKIPWQQCREGSTPFPSSAKPQEGRSFIRPSYLLT